MTRLAVTAIDDAERTLGRAILLVAHARGHVARRGHTNTRPLTAALDDVGRALAAVGGEVAPRLVPRVRALTENLAFLLAEMRESSDTGSHAEPADSFSAVA